MKTDLQRLFLSLLLLFLCTVASAAAGEVTKANSELTHADVGGSTLSNIMLAVTLGKDEIPNGMAMLRKSADPDNQVNNGANYLVDDTLTKTSSDATSSTWTISWRNAPAGDYKVYFRQTGGTGQIELGDVIVETIVSPTPEPSTVTFDIINEMCNAKGSIIINIAGGKPGFTIKGNVYSPLNAKGISTGQIAQNRAVTIMGLTEGKCIKVIITDADGHTTDEEEIWPERVGNSSMKVYQEQNIYLL